MQDLSQSIAAILGPTLVVVTLTEVRNLDIWEDVHPTVVYLNGLLFLIGGLFIVTTHNHWVLEWSGLVTLSGWLLIFAGSYRMLAPEAPQLGRGLVAYVAIAVLACLGLALSWFAFFS